MCVLYNVRQSRGERRAGGDHTPPWWAACRGRRLVVGVREGVAQGSLRGACGIIVIIIIRSNSNNHIIIISAVREGGREREPSRRLRDRGADREADDRDRDPFSSLRLFVFTRLGSRFANNNIIDFRTLCARMPQRPPNQLRLSQTQSALPRRPRPGLAESYDIQHHDVL